MKYKAPKYIPEGTSKKGGVGWSLNPKDKRDRFYTTVADSDAISMFAKVATSYEELIRALHYCPVGQNVVKWYQESGKSYEEFAKSLYCEELTSKDKEELRKIINDWNNYPERLRDLI